MSPSPLASLAPLSSTSTGPNRGESRPRTLRHEWRRVLARVTFLVFTGTAVFLYVFSLPTYYAQLLIVCPGLPSCSFFGQLSQGMLPWFQQAHLSVPSYAALFLALVSLNALLALIFGVAIVWRLWGKENEMLGLLTSFVMILAGTIATKTGSFTDFSPSTPPVLNVIGTLSFVLYWPAFGMVVMTFSTGRFAPRWTWLLLSLWLMNIVLFGILQNGSPLLFTAELLLVYGSTYGVLFYRWVHLYTYAQRQQTKWLLYGFVPVSLLVVLSQALESIPTLNTPSSVYLFVLPILEVLGYLLVPVAIGIALLRYRLWDIDVLINRTLVYGLLTVTLLCTYLVLVFGGQHVLASFLGPNNAVVLVVSTLVVAALFQPLRQRVQQLVDRRFYRSKYDAAQVVAGFGETLRQDVQETVEPTSLSLWLRPQEPPEVPGRSGTRSPLS